MSLPRCLALVAALLAAAACATPPRFDAHLASDDAVLRDCAAWYRALDAEIEAAGARDVLYARVPGFPYLRTDAALPALRARADTDARALHAFADALLELDVEARTHELANLPRGRLEVEAALRRTRDCGKRLVAADLADPRARTALLDAVAQAKIGERTAAACPARGTDPDASVHVRYAPPSERRLSRATVAGLLARAKFDPLGRIELTPGEALLIAAAYAPSFDVAIASDRDRFGRVRWAYGKEAPVIDATEPTVYARAAAVPGDEGPRLALIYRLWFPEGPTTWRVTLGQDAEPLVYEAREGCGCRPRVFALRGLADDERAVVSLASGRHTVRQVSAVRGSDSLVRYTLRPYDELRSLERPGGARRAVLDPRCP